MPIGPDHFDHSQAHNQYKKMKFTPQQWGEIVRSTADPVLDSKKEKVLYLGVPTPTVAVHHASRAASLFVSVFVSWLTFCCVVLCVVLIWLYPSPAVC